MDQFSMYELVSSFENIQYVPVSGAQEAWLVAILDADQKCVICSITCEN
jgi:hypothetical protein